MTYDFDRLVDRRRTDSSKWQKYGPDILPLWVADMDFQSPEPVIRALRDRVEHGVFGYLALEQPEFHELFADRLLKRYGWRVSPDAVVIIPGVIPGFNVAGRVFTRDELTSLAQVCLRRGLAIVADEIHCELTLGSNRHTPIASLDPEIAERTITLMAPSKTFNLAGLKCSVAVIPNATLREKFIAGRIDLVQTVNVFGYTAAFAAYRDGQPWLDELLRYLEANRDFVTGYVRSRLPGVSVFPPEATYLAWLDCRNAGIPGGDPFTFFLGKARVALNDGALFGPGGAGHVRLNFGCPRSMLVKALDQMRDALTADRPARV